MRYISDCKACHCCSSFCQPAPGTPQGEELANLFCLRCHADGRAVYRPVRVRAIARGESSAGVGSGGLWGFWFRHLALLLAVAFLSAVLVRLGCGR